MYMIMLTYANTESLDVLLKSKSIWLQIQTLTRGINKLLLHNKQAQNFKTK